jgi:hypothetical protein
VILRQRQLLLRILKLWIVVNDSNIYDLSEGKPLLIENVPPIRIVAKNGYHASKPLFVRHPHDKPVFIEVGCSADNVLLWGGVALSLLFFMMFFAIGYLVFLIIANLPLLYLVYKIFISSKDFITVSFLQVEQKKMVKKKYNHH